MTISFDSSRFTRAQVAALRRLAEEILAPVTYTVATLPDPTLGLRAIVTDANATTFHSVVAGGGANVVPVFADGADWRIG